MLQPTSDRDSGYGELLEPPPSLWRLVEEQVPQRERDEIKRILGEAAVDLSLDLHAEIEVLLELWRDIRSTCPFTIQNPPSSSCSILADPPIIKDMMTQEIRMLLLSVRMKARHQGLDEDKALSKYNPKVVSFVMGTGRPESRARSRGSGFSRPPSECRAADERPFSSLSTGSSIEDDLEELKDKLQMSHIDEVILHLRSLLEDECRTLEKDIMILQQRLEEERQCMEELQTLQAEPSLTELKEERRILERELQLDPFPATPLPTSKMASSRKPNLARLSDIGRRGGDTDCRLSQRMRSSPDLQQHEPPRTPCPPDPKLKSPEGRTVRKGTAGPRAPSCIAASPVKGPEEPGQNVPYRSVHQSLERIARVYSPLCDRGRGPCGASDRTVPANYETITLRAPVTPVNTLLVPLPPKVQRPPSSSGPAPAFRRMRTQVSNLPP